MDLSRPQKTYLAHIKENAQRFSFTEKDKRQSQWLRICRAAMRANVQWRCCDNKLLYNYDISCRSFWQFYRGSKMHPEFKKKIGVTAANNHTDDIFVQSKIDSCDICTYHFCVNIKSFNAKIMCCNKTSCDACTWSIIKQNILRSYLNRLI